MTEIIFDVEAAGLRPWSNKWCLSYEMLGEMSTVFKGFSDLVATWLEDPDFCLIGHNIVAYDLPVLFYSKTVPTIRAKIYDTLLLSRVLFPHIRSHGLESWGERFARTGDGPQKVAVDGDQWGEGNLPLMKKRCETDVVITKVLWERIKKHRFDFYDMELGWIPYIVEMLAKGIPVRLGAALREEGAVRKRFKQRSMVDNPLPGMANLGSKLAWQKYLDAKGKKLPLTDKGNLKVNKGNKLSLVRDIPELQLHFDHKNDQSLLNYLSFNIKEVRERPKSSNFWAHSAMDEAGQLRLFSSFNYYGTRTLRSAYRGPCVNSFPKGALRSMVGHITGSEYRLLGIDIDQLELAWLGYFLRELCGDSTIWDEKEKNLNPKVLTLKAFDGLFYNIPEEERETVAKTINYAMIYGQRPAGTCAVLRLPQDPITLDKIVAARERRFPSLEQLVRVLDAKVSSSGYMLNAYKQPVFALKERDGDEYSTSLNTMMQSSGNAYAKQLFSSIMRRLKEAAAMCHLLLTNHDEMQVGVPKSLTQELCDDLIKVACQDFNRMAVGGIPLITGVKHILGDTWQQTH